MSIEIVKQNIADSISVKEKLLGDEIIINQLIDLASDCIKSLKKGGKIIFCGNGGSFADAQHLSAEFTSRFLFDRPGLASIALGTNSSSMTAIGNDYGYENVFSREIESIASTNDVIIMITTSGNSKNIIKALEVTKKNNISTVVFTGQGNGKLNDEIITLNVPSKETARIQECHILMGHIICGIVENEMFKNKA
tara:strand:+ start:5374 stop:5958 length:585 start_codon:yes stop_codon:yes gene_type:complete